MTELIHPYLLEIGLFTLILIATLLCHLLVRNRTFTLLVFGFSCLVLLLVSAISLLSNFLSNHIVAEHINGIVTPHISRSGWGLLIDVWPIWVVPSLFSALLTGLIAAWFIPGENRNYLNVVQQASKEVQSTGPTATSSRLVIKQLEINELQRKLEICEEKFRQARDGNKQKPLRLDKYMTELSELRQKAGEFDRQIHNYKAENKRLTTELADAQRLIDELMRS